MITLLTLKVNNPLLKKGVDQESSEVPSGQSAQQYQTHLDSIFMLLEDDIVTFVKNELKKIQKLLSPDYPECSESQKKDEDEEQKRSSREAFLKITLHFLRRMKQDELADRLQSTGPELQSSRRLRSEATVSGTEGSFLETGHSQGGACWSQIFDTRSMEIFL
ncbi:hypothetical protein EPR50_G00193540 [Perca flavescens]|uniref:Uncharacterized protein n=1 Tax=Perca flavescens TaxID=8167 RepID=A0A484CCK8_PERFV|nr:hypothetical protein EPR50_G00193540 [Perca flavescens]